MPKTYQCCGMVARERFAMVKLVALTAAAIFIAEALIMLILETLGEGVPLLVRILLDSTLLLICVLPTLYFLIFKEMSEQIQRRRKAEESQAAWNQSLELQIVERTVSLRRANEDLLTEVQERARSGMVLRKALNEECSLRNRLQTIFDAVQDAIVVVDVEGRILLANRRAEGLFHNSRSDLSQRCVKDFLRAASGDDPALDFSKGSQPVQLLVGGERETKRVMMEMRTGETFEWDGDSATVLMLCARDDGQ